jgi:AraC-like DNA-binding protein
MTSLPAGYMELPPPAALEQHVACVWISGGTATHVLPDACVDVVLDGEQLVVAGPQTVSRFVPEAPGQHRCGVRFRIASAGSVLGLPAARLLDLNVPASEVWGTWGRRLENRVNGAGNARDALERLTAGLAERVLSVDERDLVIRHAALAMIQGHSLGRASRMVGLGERQLRRRFDEAVGYGPATLVRVERFQRFLSMAERAQDVALARLAADAGYADQAHLARECRRLSGSSPAQLLARGAGAAGEKSVLFKPGGTESVTLAA